MSETKRCSCSSQMYRNEDDGTVTRKIAGKTGCFRCGGYGVVETCAACSGAGMLPGSTKCTECWGTGVVPVKG